MRKIVFGIDIDPLLNASTYYLDALTMVENDLTRDGAIQRFEYTFELCWKTMRRILREKGSEVVHPRDVFREAAADKLIPDPASWFGYLELRNKSAHIYKKEVAEEVYAGMPDFKKALEALLAVLENLPEKI